MRRVERAERMVFGFIALCRDDGLDDPVRVRVGAEMMRALEMYEDDLTGGGEAMWCETVEDGEGWGYSFDFEPKGAS